jgi:hypothetical protein
MEGQAGQPPAARSGARGHNPAGHRRRPGPPMRCRRLATGGALLLSGRSTFDREPLLGDTPAQKNDVTARGHRRRLTRCRRPRCWRCTQRSLGTGYSAGRRPRAPFRVLSSAASTTARPRPPADGKLSGCGRWQARSGRAGSSAADRRPSASGRVPFGAVSRPVWSPVGARRKGHSGDYAPVENCHTNRFTMEKRRGRLTAP